MYKRITFIKEWTNYTHNVNPNVYLYSVNLAGNSTSSVPQNTKNTALIGGFSERIFDFVTTFESDKRATVEKIKELYGS